MSGLIGILHVKKGITVVCLKWFSQSYKQGNKLGLGFLKNLLYIIKDKERGREKFS
jgi:hypothetical protein